MAESLWKARPFSYIRISPFLPPSKKNELKYKEMVFYANETFGEDAGISWLDGANFLLIKKKQKIENIDTFKQN